MNAMIASIKRHPLATFLGLTFSGGFVSQLFAGADMMQQAWSLTAVWVGAAAALLLLAGPNLGRQPAAQPQAIYVIG